MLKFIESSATSSSQISSGQSNSSKKSNQTSKNTNNATTTNNNNNNANKPQQTNNSANTTSTTATVTNSNKNNQQTSQQQSQQPNNKKQTQNVKNSKPDAAPKKTAETVDKNANTNQAASIKVEVLSTTSQTAPAIPTNFYLDESNKSLVDELGDLLETSSIKSSNDEFVTVIKGRKVKKPTNQQDVSNIAKQPNTIKPKLTTNKSQPTLASTGNKPQQQAPVKANKPPPPLVTKIVTKSSTQPELASSSSSKASPSAPNKTSNLDTSFPPLESAIKQCTNTNNSINNKNPVEETVQVVRESSVNNSEPVSEIKTTETTTSKKIKYDFLRNFNSGSVVFLDELNSGKTASCDTTKIAEIKFGFIDSSSCDDDGEETHANVPIDQQAASNENEQATSQVLAEELTFMSSANFETLIKQAREAAAAAVNKQNKSSDDDDDDKDDDNNESDVGETTRKKSHRFTKKATSKSYKSNSSSKSSSSYKKKHSKSSSSASASAASHRTSLNESSSSSSTSSSSSSSSSRSSSLERKQHTRHTSKYRSKKLKNKINQIRESNQTENDNANKVELPIQQPIVDDVNDSGLRDSAQYQQVHGEQMENGSNHMMGGHPMQQPIMQQQQPYYYYNPTTNTIAAYIGPIYQANGIYSTPAGSMPIMHAIPILNPAAGGANANTGLYQAGSAAGQTPIALTVPFSMPMQYPMPYASQAYMNQAAPGSAPQPPPTVHHPSYYSAPGQSMPLSAASTPLLPAPPLLMQQNVDQTVSANLKSNDQTWVFLNFHYIALTHYNDH